MKRQVVYVMSGPAHLPYLLVSLCSLRQHWDGEVVVYAWPNLPHSLGCFDIVQRIAKDDRLDIRCQVYEPGYRKRNAQFECKIAVMKSLDCEGSELKALQGAEKFIEGVEVVNLEMTSNPANEGWADPVETHQWLLRHDFLRQTIHTNRSRGGQYDAIYVRTHLHQMRFCSCPCKQRIEE